MKEIITTGKTVELAIEDACRQLGVEREKAEFEIIDLPKKGLFGLKTYPAKVRVFVKEDKAEMAVEYVTSVLRAMGAQDFTAEANQDGENLNITLKGDDLGFVIGRRGETIDAIQYLASLAVNRLDGDYMRITIDSGNFREKREKTLESLARRLARNVVKTGRSRVRQRINRCTQKSIWNNPRSHRQNVGGFFSVVRWIGFHLSWENESDPAGRKGLFLYNPHFANSVQIQSGRKL